MSHTRGDGHGNMAGSDDRTLAELHAEVRERVIVGGGYADVSGDEVERLIADWRPIATAPVKPWTPELESYYRFSCLLQNNAGHVFEGSASYVVSQRVQPKGADRRGAVLRWYGHAHRWEPYVVYWMPLPAARIEL